MRTPSYIMLMALLLVLGKARTATRAQQQPEQDASQDQSEPPIPAYQSPLASGTDNGAIGNGGQPSDYTPDTSSDHGSERIFPSASLEGDRSYWQPHADVVITGDSNALQTTGTDWTMWSSFYGGINVHRVAGKSAMTLSYTGRRNNFKR